MKLLRRSTESEPPDMLRAALEVAFEQPGCPFCHLIRKAEQRVFWITLWENVTDPDIRIGFQVRRGFCAHHTSRFGGVDRDEHLGGSGVAAFLEGLCITVAEDLVRRPPAVRIPRCEPCENDERKMRTWTNVLLREAPRASFRTAYERSHGLCLEHLRVVLSRARNAATGLWLVQTTRAQFSTLHMSENGPTVPSSPTRSAGRGGCPVCRALQETERLALEELAPSEAANGAAPSVTSLELFTCEPHTQRLLVRRAVAAGALEAPQRQQGLARAWWGRLAQVEDAYQAHAAQAAAFRIPRALSWRIPDSSWPAVRCVPCERVCDVSSQLVAAAAHTLDEADALESAADGRALCRSHLADVLALSPAPARAQLAGLTARRLRALADSLRDFQRKCGWQARDEPKGDEQHALARALAFFA